ncbi:non-histone chromosomal protein HMG-14-like [Apodemus sylvaticus]|uniref:non-histone chromosomal protein HMG-14-like n=1 Tax=Apodemus sylvaticus TaxID=10129 RepID=UPI002243BEA8|nr:non-histone chromosomal protein HMG-14-like [Apodemus sylvaticus]
MPKKRVSTDGAAKAEPKCWSTRLLGQAHPCQGRCEIQKKAMGKDKASDKNVPIKGKQGAKGKQADVSDQQPTDLPAEIGDRKPESSL